MPTVEALKIGQSFTIDAAAILPAPAGQEQFQYSLFGLAENTGLKISATTGKITGSPAVADARVVQPMRVIVFAHEASTEKGRATFYLDVLSGSFLLHSSDGAPRASSRNTHPPP